MFRCWTCFRNDVGLSEVWRCLMFWWMSSSSVSLVSRTSEWRKWATWRGSCRASRSWRGTAAPARSRCLQVGSEGPVGPDVHESGSGPSLLQLRLCCLLQDLLPAILLPLLPLSITSTNQKPPATIQVQMVPTRITGTSRFSPGERTNHMIHECLFISTRTDPAYSSGSKLEPSERFYQSIK